MAIPTKQQFLADAAATQMKLRKRPEETPVLGSNNTAAPVASAHAAPAKPSQAGAQRNEDAPLPSKTRAMIQAEAAKSLARMEVRKQEREAKEALEAKCAEATQSTDEKAPAKKRSRKRRAQIEHTVTLRDLHILKGLEKPGVVSRGQIRMIIEDYHRLQGTKAPIQKTVNDLMCKLVQMGFLKRSVIHAEHSGGNKNQKQTGACTVWSLTKEGLKLLNGPTAGPVVDIGFSKWAHELAASWVIITHWIDGWSILSAAEIDAASKRSYAQTDSYVQDKNFKADPFYGDPETCLNDVGFMTIHTGTRGGHRPDAVLFKDADDGQRHIIAVEVERSKKRSEDLDAIFYGYHSALDEGRFTAVRYYYAPEIKNHLENYLRGKSILNDRRFEFIPFDAEEAHAVVPTVRS